MRVDVIGAGSLGLLLAGRLIAGGAEVRIWCRGKEQSRALTAEGLTVSYEDGREATRLPGGSFSAAPVQEYTQCQLDKPGEVTLLTVKQKVLHESLPEILRPLSARKLVIVGFQNGCGHLELLRGCCRGHPSGRL